MGRERLQTLAVIEKEYILNLDKRFYKQILNHMATYCGQIYH